MALISAIDVLHDNYTSSHHNVGGNKICGGTAGDGYLFGTQAGIVKALLISK